jgi:hypothetical protein
MCCSLLLVMLLGPRALVLFWWILEPGRWDRAFDTVIVPILGFVFLPWTTLMFVAVAPFGNVEGWDWFWLAIGFVGDLVSLGGSFGGRRQVPYYPQSYP